MASPRMFHICIAKVPVKVFWPVDMLSHRLGHLQWSYPFCFSPSVLVYMDNQAKKISSNSAIQTVHLSGLDPFVPQIWAKDASARTAAGVWLMLHVRPRAPGPLHLTLSPTYSSDAAASTLLRLAMAPLSTSLAWDAAALPRRPTPAPYSSRRRVLPHRPPVPPNPLGRCRPTI
jgi:hypothetical protein